MPPADVGCGWPRNTASLNPAPTQTRQRVQCAAMNLADYHYDLPAEAIAQAPADERTASRLLTLGKLPGEWHDARFGHIADQLKPGDLLVLNDTRVIPARLAGRKASGGKVEMLLERVVNEREALAQLRSSKSPRDGTELEFEGGAKARVLGRDGIFFRLRFDRDIQSFLERHGHVPLPPYIKRLDTGHDKSRYQTVYADVPGAVAAPTAGLHFDGPLLARIETAGVEIARITLHVGAGTFAPLRSPQIESGRLHAERIQVSPGVCRAVAATRANGGRIVAVGTTVVRALESAALGGDMRPFSGETDLFIKPGFEFRATDMLITNFHLPESSLLMLVCAFGGHERVMQAYRHAVSAGYRFYSYGDAMSLERQAVA
jgi:S-adenosylmethionine:tRNA ribosyltransferase-isomerase